MNDPDPNREKKLPAEIAEGLAGLRKELMMVPPEVDAAVLAEAKAHLGGAGQGGRGRFNLAPWLAAAAVLIAALVVTRLVFYPGSEPVKWAEDIDRNGRVDIVDALVLARKVELGQVGGGTQFDLNGDGMVDRFDVDAVAQRAVRLEGGPRS